FSGDTLFPGGPGNTSFENASFDTIIESIDRRLFTLPADTLVLPGHGLDTTIASESPHLDEWIARGWEPGASDREPHPGGRRRLPLLRDGRNSRRAGRRARARRGRQPRDLVPAGARVCARLLRRHVGSTRFRAVDEPQRARKPAHGDRRPARDPRSSR